MGQKGWFVKLIYTWKFVKGFLLACLPKSKVFNGHDGVIFKLRSGKTQQEISQVLWELSNINNYLSTQKKWTPYVLKQNYLSTTFLLRFFRSIAYIWRNRPHLRTQPFFKFKIPEILLFYNELLQWACIWTVFALHLKFLSG